MVAFYNQQFLTAAGIASSSLSDSSAAADKLFARHAPKASTVGSLVGETIVLVNPARNYAQFLLRTLLPMVLHVVIAISAGYAVGSEFRRRSIRAWLACAGGNPIVALAGKLAPLFGIFFIFMLSFPLLLEGLLGISFKGDVLMMMIAASLLIIGYLGLGALLQLLVCDLAIGLGLTGLVVSPAFGYAGVGFPTFGMNAFAQVWGSLLPVRWYMAVLLGQAARGLPLAYFGTPVRRSSGPCRALHAIGISPPGCDQPKIDPEVTCSRASRGAGGAKRFGGHLHDGVAPRAHDSRGLYPLGGWAINLWPLLPAALSEPNLAKISIAVVDNDLSELSRRIVQTLDASGAVSVAIRANTFPEARAALSRGKAFAVVEIPPGTERDVLKEASSMCRSMLMPRTCSSSERWPPASPSRLIRLRWNCRSWHAP